MKRELVFLRALADETRLHIVEFLLDGKKCVCEIFPFIKKTQSTASIHLGILKKAGILDSGKDGKKVYYFIKDDRVYGILKILGLFKKSRS